MKKHINALPAIHHANNAQDHQKMSALTVLQDITMIHTHNHVLIAMKHAEIV